MKQYKARRAAPHAQPRSTRHTPNECDPRDIRSTLRLTRAPNPAPPPRCVQGANWTKLEPHVFATSEMAYNHMVINAQSQSLLVAGESVRRTPRHMHIMRRPPPPASSSNRRCEPHVLAPTHSRLTFAGVCTMCLAGRGQDGDEQAAAQLPHLARGQRRWRHLDPFAGARSRMPSSAPQLPPSPPGSSPARACIVRSVRRDDRRPMRPPRAAAPFVLPLCHRSPKRCSQPTSGPPEIVVVSFAHPPCLKSHRL